MILSIVIVNWNGKELTKNCIESIVLSNREKIEKNEFEIILADNGSNDGSAEYFKSLNLPVRLITNTLNIGYAPACNQGMREATGNYILLLGNDTIVLDGSLEKCITFLEENADCGAVGCRLLNADNSYQNNCKKFPKLINGFFTYLSLDRLNWNYDMAEFKYDETRMVEQISTTFLMIRRNLLEKITYFDETYKILYNDVDLCRRIWSTGSKIYFLHTAEVIHFGSQSTKLAGFYERKIMYSDIYRYYRRNFGIRAYLLLPVLSLRLLIVYIAKK
jgi:GT2 family glycosyltransferase